MSRNIGLAVGFFGTVAVLVPAGWHTLDADLQRDGKRLRPMQQSFTVKGVRVTLDVDRTLVETGGKVKARLVAFSDKPKQVAVDLTVQHTSNYAGERVEPIADTIDIEKLTLDAAPGGGKPVETILTLGEHVDKKAMTDTFRIYVAKKGERPSKYIDGGGGDEEDGDNKLAATSAAVTVMGWSGNSVELAIDTEGKPSDGEPFFVRVRAKNTSKRVLHGLYIDLGTKVGDYGGITVGDDFKIEQVDEPAASDDVDGYRRKIKRGGVETVRFKVTPQRKGVGNVTFVAQAISTEDAPGPVVAGGLDTKTVTLRDTSRVAVK